MVVDGYEFDTTYEQALKDAGLKLLRVDDSASVTYCLADLVLNQNAYAREELYRESEPYTRLLLGPRYALLRREFAGWGEWQREITPIARKVLVTIGGSDPDNVSLAVIEALCLVKTSLEVVVVVGGSNPHIRSLQTAAAQFPGNMRLVTNAAMPELMVWADFTISGSGTTTAEICMLGLPAMVIDIAPTNSPVAKELDRAGVAIHVDVTEVRNHAIFADRVQSVLVSAEYRTSISRTARKLVDGHGLQRVVSAILGTGLKLRPVEEKDCRRLWEWANDPVVREASFCQDLIPWEQHVNWFQAQMRDQSTRIMVAMDSDQADIGTVRFNLEGNRAVVSISLDKRARGKGQGCAILKMATEELFWSSSAVAIDAYVKPQNEASKRLFENANFQERSSLAIIHGEQAAHFVLERNGAR